MRDPRVGRHPVDGALLALTHARPAPAILSLRALGLGDLLTALPALRALGDAFPGYRRVLATTPGVAPLAVHAGVADEVLPTEPLARLAWPAPAPALAVNLHGRGPQSHRVLLATAPRRLVAFRCGEVPGPEWRADEHEVQRWCRLLAESGIPTDATRLELAPPHVPVAPGVEGATLLHPGAASPARRWPADRWAAVARGETAAGRSVVVTGGPAEVGLAREVATRAALAPSAVLAGATGVLELAATVAAAGRVVCGDTGVAHLATALGRPSVVLFGPVPPSRWGPPPDRPWHVALWAGTTGDPHGLSTDRGLLEITVTDVVTALDRLAPADPSRRHRAATPSS